MKPFKYQTQILKELTGKDKAIVHVASGGGKTNIAAFEVARKKPKSFIYIVHRNEILFQSLAAFKNICTFLNDDNIGIINQQFKEPYKPYLFATIQTLGRGENLKSVIPNMEMVIIDEAHHMAARTYRKVLKYFKQKTFRGLSATPFRMDQQNILRILDEEKDTELIGNIDILEGIHKGILCPFLYYGFWDNVNWNGVYVYQGYKYKKKDLDKTLLIQERDKLVIEKYKEMIEPEHRQTIAFCATIKHVKRMVEKFNAAGIRSEGIDYEQDIRHKARVLDHFRKGEIQVMFTVDILNEGVDFPECKAIIFLRPTGSEVVFKQQLGRGLRTKEGKKNVLVLDFIGNYAKSWRVHKYLEKIIGQPPMIFEPGKFYKPEYLMKVPYYAFDSRVIETMELQKKLQKVTNPGYTDKELIDNYYAIKEKLGRQPLAEELPFTEISNIGKDAYRGHFGSWNMFLRYIGEPVIVESNVWTKKELIDNYYEVKKKLNRPLTFDDMDQGSISKWGYINKFGSWGKFLLEVSEKARRRLPKSHDLKDLKEKYWTLKKKIGKPQFVPVTPKEWKNEYGVIGNYTFIKHYGDQSWKNFLNDLGEKLLLKCYNCQKLFTPKWQKPNTKRHFCSQTCARNTYNKEHPNRHRPGYY